MKDRDLQIVELRDSGGLTFEQIGTRFLMSKSRANQIYAAAKRSMELERRPDLGMIWTSKLSVRARNCLYNFGFTRETTKPEVLENIHILRAGAGCGHSSSIKNMGKKTLQEIESWAGATPLPIPPDPPICRCCGQRIRKKTITAQ